MEEATYASAAAVAAARPRLRTSPWRVSPSLLGLFPVLASARLRRFPWILWLEDILPDAAATTGLMREGRRAATAQQPRAFHLSLRGPDRRDLERVPREPAGQGGATVEGRPTSTTPIRAASASSARRENGGGPARILYMGNMGFSQNLPALVRAFERSPAVGDDVRLILAGTGELAREVGGGDPLRPASRCPACCSTSWRARWSRRPSGSSRSGPTSTSSTCPRS